MKKKYSFTIDETLMEWFRLYVRDESTKMSAVLNQKFDRKAEDIERRQRERLEKEAAKKKQKK